VKQTDIIFRPEICAEESYLDK